MKSSIVHDNFSINFLSISNAGKNGCDTINYYCSGVVNGKNRLRHAYEVTFLDFQWCFERPSPFIENNAIIPTRHHLS